MVTLKDFERKEKPQWCPGCGDYSILIAVKGAYNELGLNPKDTVMVSGIGCLPVDEKVSLGNKWDSIQEINEGDAIINGEGKEDEVSKRFVRSFEGELYEIRPRVSPFNTFKVTEEHPVFCVRKNKIRSRNRVDKQKLNKIVPEYVEAKDLQEGDYLVFSYPREVKDDPEITPEFCRLLGYYLAEGWINETGGRNRDSANVSFALHSDEKEIIEELTSLSIKFTGKKPYIRYRKEIGKVVEVTICSKKLALKLKEIAGKGARNKKLPKKFMILPQSKQMEIMNTYIMGDGCENKCKIARYSNYKISTVSVQLAIQVQEILARSGHFATIYTVQYKPHRYQGRWIRPSGKTYIISYQPKKAFTQTHSTSYGFLVPIGKIKREYYTGNVYNLEMKSEPHSYLARGFVVHNCNSKIPHYVNVYGYEGLHGRTLPLASGIKIANRKLTVLAFSGDGDGYGEGAQHFVHICRRNYDMTYIVHNNQIYGLTTGQASPTTEKGQKTKSTPFGVLETQFNPLASAITNGATYVARTFAGDLVHMKEMIKGAITHKGFSLVDIFQPCVTFNSHNTYDWFRQRVYKLEETGYKPNDFFKAIEKAYEDSNTNYEKVPIGLFYKADKPTYEGELPQLKERELVEKDISKVNIEHLLKEFM